MKGEILKLLKETDGYISGQELCEKFGVSRTAVWKVINQLKEEGYEILDPCRFDQFTYVHCGRLTLKA